MFVPKAEKAPAFHFEKKYEGPGFELGVGKKGKLQKVERKFIFQKYPTTMLFEIVHKWF